MPTKTRLETTITTSGTVSPETATLVCQNICSIADEFAPLVAKEKPVRPVEKLTIKLIAGLNDGDIIFGCLVTAGAHRYSLLTYPDYSGSSEWLYNEEIEAAMRWLSYNGIAATKEQVEALVVAKSLD